LPFLISDIFRNEDVKHRLTLFSQENIDWLERSIFEKNAKPYITCLGSGRDRILKPEEVVRQLWIKKIIDEYHYPRERIRVEKEVWFGSGVSEKRADIVITHSDSEEPYIIFEIKKPMRKNGIQQLKSYCNAEGSPIGAWSNGEELIILHREEPNIFTQISNVPTVDQTLVDVITEAWTIEKLTRENKLVKEKLSLKKIILDLEDLVLANAGVDAFDEIFKISYAKLYDEWAAINLPTRHRRIQFRIYGESSTELYRKISNLFNDAKRKWQGVFTTSDRISLTPSHLRTCVSFLQDVRLFNANLQIIDEAFEYLVTQVAKGSKGQYFTPRWVIDMCIKMLNPKAQEYIIDPAAGSCGFLVHTIMWVAGSQITASGLPPHAQEFAQNNVYAIDFDEKALKIGKAMNLIAGDGKSNVYLANSLDPPNWREPIKEAFRPFLLNEHDERYQNFTFDCLFTNPPFAGKIRERPILRQYQLAEKKGKLVSTLSREILFIERCLSFIRPGGRMAIILPQGLLNNLNAHYIRNHIFKTARILAVVSLHVNTFKPHTGTKTSVLFLQKYTSQEIAEQENIRNQYLQEFEEHINLLETLNNEESIPEDQIPDVLLDLFNYEFPLESDIELDEDLEFERGETELPVFFIEKISEYEERLDSMPNRFRGKKEFENKIHLFKYYLSTFSIKGKLNWVLTNEKLLTNYKEIWLNQQIVDILNYPIFFAVSNNGGKNRSGNPIYEKDETDEIRLDEHGHLIVSHDLDEIAENFKLFAQSNSFDFWND